MINSFKKILVLAPHTDDAELGCGGTIAQLTNIGKEVFWAVFSKASVSQDFFTDPNIVLEELKESAKILGVGPDRLFIYDYPLRNFFQCRQDILEEMRGLQEKIKPDLVFMPSPHDIHQDHQAVAQDGLRAFKNITILGYEEPWSNLTFNTTCFNLLNEEDLKKKVEAVKKYRSQSHRCYTSEEFIRSLAQVRGVQARVGEEAQAGVLYYAEAFEVIRLMFK